MSIKIVIADDHELVRKGLVNIFEESDIEIIGQAADGNEAVELTKSLQPDVLLLDVRMPEADGVQALTRLRTESPDTKVVMYSMYDNPTYVARSVALGAKDYLLKSASQMKLIDTITRVAAGGAPEAGGLFEQVKATMAVRRNSRDDIPLTNLETQVLRHIALGLSNKEIGVSLNISIETVKEHVQNILRKIDATDRTQAAIWAVRKGLMETEDEG